jgi:hypothetical protein
MYKVTISKSFESEDPIEAVKEMIDLLSSSADDQSYRVSGPHPDIDDKWLDLFVDAQNL